MYTVSYESQLSTVVDTSSTSLKLSSSCSLDTRLSSSVQSRSSSVYGSTGSISNRSASVILLSFQQHLLYFLKLNNIQPMFFHSKPQPLYHLPHSNRTLLYYSHFCYHCSMMKNSDLCFRIRSSDQLLSHLLK